MNHGDIEPRFVVSRTKVAASLGMSSQSGSSYFSKRRESHTDIGSFYNNAQVGPAPIGPQPDVLSGSPSSTSSNESRFTQSRHSSMADLKRFFKKAPPTSPLQPSYLMSPSQSYTSMSSSRDRAGSVSSMSSVSQYTTPQLLPFSKRYSKFGESLGAGAGGSVRLVKRLNDNVVFAVKEFRPRSQTESRREYAKKITGEYCIGSTLRHANIIETVEIAYENDRLLQVLEYCDYDLFALVMSNKMPQAEVDCCFKQILTGIQYLHHMGLAHRDLKLDNCVVNAHGIVKLIDFGSAVVFSYPFSQTLIEASGIVGSDPYLSPETLVFSKYDPRPVDIWSAAMIYCCMTLKKFPWKVPKLSDNSFKLFCSGRDSDSLSALLTRSPPPKAEEPKTIAKPSGLSNLTKAFSQVEVTPTVTNVDDDDATPVPSSQTETPPPEQPTASAASTETETSPQPEPHTSNLIGEARLLQALPTDVRPVIGRMVDLAPACRASIDDVMSDPWVSSIAMCTMENKLDGSGMAQPVYHHCDNHQHTQVDQSEAHIASLEKKKGKKN